ncbi:MAG: FIST N-terminal domain-containing protein [Solirubrobacteraceae bacterium]
MPVRIGAALSTDPDPRAGALEAASAARDALGSVEADLALVFACGHHLAAPEATLEGVHDGLGPRRVVGCGAGGVLGCGREVEGGTAVAVWAAALGGGEATPFHAQIEPADGGMRIVGLPELAGGDAALLLADPYTFPTDGLLRELGRRAPAVPVLGGLASGRTDEGTGALFLDERVTTEGAVGLRIDGVEVMPCVSQGAAPLGPEMTVTDAEGDLVRELAGRPALERLRQAIDELRPDERALVEGGLLIGLLADGAGGKPEYGPGDFLVRGLSGADPETGAVHVGAPARPGQVVRLHARDARSADLELRQALGLRRGALGGRPPAGALIFSCNGRGRGMFGSADHDAALLATELGGAHAGFFAAGEIGPVGQESFLHGFTATLAIFPG